MRIMTLASTVFKKNQLFIKISLLNALGSQFDLDVKQVKVILENSCSVFMEVIQP